MRLPKLSKLHLSKNAFTTIIGALLITTLLSSCATPGQTAGAVAGGILGVTTVGAYKVGPEIQQVYYLGMYDSTGTLPTQMYRVTVHGQSSFISGATFASGWVPAALVDTLECHISPGLTTDKEAQQQSTPLLCSPRNKSIPPSQDAKPSQPQTKDIKDSDPAATSDAPQHSDPSSLPEFWALGPEALRRVPKDHRLVIVMGMDADAFFQEVDKVLGNISLHQTQVPLTADQKIQIRNGLTQTKNARTRIEELTTEVTKSLNKQP